MNNFFTQHSKVFSSLIAGVLVLSFVLAPVAINKYGESHLKTVEATVVEDVLNQPSNWGTWLAGLATKAYTALTSSLMNNLYVKEYIQDGTAWALTNLVLEEMIKSTTRWVASGFQGSPVFVTDLQGFVMNLGDKIAGDFIYGSSLAALCSPFKLNIQFALDLQYSRTRSYKAQCTLTSVVNNVSNFMEGDFLSGGWNEWFRMTQIPGNNQYGALMEAQAGMSATIRNARNEEVKLLDFGKGLMSLKDANGKIITPGTSIESSLNEAINTPGKRLTVADEINELLGTLFSQLVKTVLSSGSGGLAGLGNGGSNEAYWNNMSAQSAQQGLSSGGGVFATALNTVNENLNLQNAIISNISAMSIWTSSCNTGGLSPTLSSYLANAEAAKTSDTDIINTINTFQSDYNALGNGNTALIAKYGGSSVNEAQLILINQYNAYTNSGVIPTMDTNISLQTTAVPAINNEIQALKQYYEQACSSVGTG